MPTADILEHPFPPIADANSRVLILGSFPSIKSFEVMFYYGHPKNQFWPIMARLFDLTLDTNEQRSTFALKYAIALWDVYASIVRTEGNSSDQNLGSTVVNDFTAFFKTHPKIGKLFFTGKKAYAGYKKAYGEPHLPYEVLPSTSPAYAVMRLDAKYEHYKTIKAYLDSGI